METVLLNIIPSLVDKFIKGDLTDDNNFLILQKLFLLECRINLKILEIAQHDKVSNVELAELLSRLKNDSSKALFSFASNSMIKKILKKAKLVKDKYDLKNDTVLISLISKIELLKILGEDFKDFQENKVINLRSRVTNLNKQLRLVIQELNEEI